MPLKTRALLVPLLLALGLPGCFGSATGGPGREAMVAELQKEAAALKKENEGQDSSLGVTATWNVASVDVTEPATKDGQWKGSIRFQIHSETRDGSKVQVDDIEKTFHYVYNDTIKKWVFEYQPSS
jgi:hypothetical protein